MNENNENEYWLQLEKSYNALLQKKQRSRLERDIMLDIEELFQSHNMILHIYKYEPTTRREDTPSPNA